MNFYTIADLDSTRVFELDNRTYDMIRDKFARMAGVNGANKLMWK